MDKKTVPLFRNIFILVLFMLAISRVNLSAQEDQFFIGWAFTDITPEKTVATAQAGGAAGNITTMVSEYVYRRTENIMLERKGITFRQELANRLLHAVDDVMPYVKNDIEYS